MKRSNFRILAGILFPVVLGLASAACLLPGPFRAKNQGGAQQPPTAQQPAQYTQGKTPIPPKQVDPDSQFDQVSIESLEQFRKGNFSWVEESANKARRDKERLPGGYWKLYAIYRGITSPDFTGTPSDADWKTHIETLKGWKEKHPESITARVALAETWSLYAWEARGGGYSNSVSDGNYKLFFERFAEARKELDDAKKLNIYCPQWYDVKLTVALAEGWKREQYDEVYDEAFAHEPTYYYFQRAKSTYLLPRWHGKEGDWARFVAESSDKIGGDEGKMLYFIMVGNMQQVYGGGLFQKNDVSWEKAKEGYEAMKKICGADNYRTNQYAAMALYSEDFETAKIAFDTLGDHWNQDIWHEKKVFDEVKTFIDQAAAARARDTARGVRPRDSKKPQNP